MRLLALPLLATLPHLCDGNGRNVFAMTVDAVSEVVCVSVVLHCGGSIELYFLR